MAESKPEFKFEERARLLPQALSAPPSKATRYFGPAVKAAIFLSSILVLMLLIGPFGYPFGDNLGRALLSGLFFISNSVSLLYYLAQIRRRRHEAKENLRKYPTIAPETTTNRILIFALIGFVCGVAIAVLTILNTGFTAGTMINGFLFASFTGGIFLSLGCRLIRNNKNRAEKNAIWATFGACLLTAAVLIFTEAFDVTHLLPALEHLSKYTFLGINLFTNILFAIIALSSYIGKAWDYATQDKTAVETVETSDISVATRLWEHRLSIFGLGLGGVVFIVTGALISDGFDPFGGGILTTLCAGIMAFAASASILSKVGRSIDEALATPRPKTTWLLYIYQHANLAYIARLVAAMGLFAMLGFALYGLSGLAVPGEFLMLPWALASPVFALSLAALAVACIANWTMGLLKPSIKNIPPCQTMASVEQANAIMTELLPQDGDAAAVPEILGDALFEHIKHAQKLLSPEWRSSLFSYAPAGIDNNYDPSLTEIKKAAEKAQRITTGIERDHALLTRLSTPAARSAKSISRSDKEALQGIFAALRTAEVDSTYRPKLSREKFILLAFTTASLLMGCVTLLFAIFTGNISVVAIQWALPLATVFGLSSWVTASYLLNNTSGGPYAVWAATALVAAVIFLALTITAGFGIPIIGVDLASKFGMLLAMSLLLSLIVIPYLLLKAHSHATTPASKKKNKNVEFIEAALTVLKVLLACGFLLLAAATVAMFFNLEGIGNGLMTWAFQVIGDALGIGGYELGAQLLGIFSITIFATASFIAFELFKNLLKTSPNHVKGITQHEDKIALATWLFKLIFNGVIIVALTSMPNSFLPGAEVALLPVFLVVMLVMPLFSTNANIPFKRLQWLNDLFNTWLGLKPLGDKNNPMPGWRLLRECGVMGLLASISIFAAYLAGAAASIAGPVAAIGVVTTMLFRWGTMEWQARHNQIELAQDYLSAQKVAVSGLGFELSLSPLSVPLGRSFDPSNNPIAAAAVASVGASAFPTFIPAPREAGRESVDSELSNPSPLNGSPAQDHSSDLAKTEEENNLP